MGPGVEEGFMAPSKVSSSPDTWPTQKTDPLVCGISVACVDKESVSGEVTV